MQLSDSQVRGLLRLTPPFDENDTFSEAFPEGGFIDGHHLIRLVGEGGMGRVYEARRASGTTSVALKVLKPELDSERERRRFFRTAEQVAEFSHPHIARILHVGADASTPYFTMEFVAGGSLLCAKLSQPSNWQPRSKWREWLGVGSRLTKEQRALAELASKVARAIDYAHKRGLLHRDIKPGNILIDAQGEPRLVDFGLARRIEPGADSSHAAGSEGSLYYMSPEQIAGGADGLTVRADIYSLGATFYELLTGVPPYRGEYLQVRTQVQGAIPVPAPSSLAPWVHPYLEAICLKCLEKSPNARYQSAAMLAQDFESVALGRPPSIPPLSAFRRVSYTLRRHPARTRRALLAVAALLSCVGLVLYALQRREARYREVVVANTAIASGQAGAAMLQLRAYADRVREAAAKPAFAAYAEQREPLDDPGEQIHQFASGFDAAYVLSTDGLVRAQWPVPKHEIWDRQYLFRDYFRGAKALAERGQEGVHVALAFRSERDDELKFAVSAPIYDQGRWVGVLVGAMVTDRVFGAVRTNVGDPERTTALLGPRGIDRPDIEKEARGELRPHYVTLIHEGLQRGQEVPMDSSPDLMRAFAQRAAPGEQFALEFPAPRVNANYRDPVAGFEGEWIAAFAPVGHTGYVIVTQSRKSSWW